MLITEVIVEFLHGESGSTGMQVAMNEVDTEPGPLVTAFVKVVISAPVGTTVVWVSVGVEVQLVDMSLEARVQSREAKVRIQH